MRKLMVSEFLSLDGVMQAFKLKSAKPYPTGVVDLHYELAR